MAKPTNKKQRRGRPTLGIKKKSISLTHEDETFFKNLGAGSLSIGIRQAGRLLRRKGASLC